MPLNLVSSFTTAESSYCHSSITSYNRKIGFTAVGSLSEGPVLMPINLQGLLILQRYYSKFIVIIKFKKGRK